MEGGGQTRGSNQPNFASELFPCPSCACIPFFGKSYPIWSQIWDIGSLPLSMILSSLASSNWAVRPPPGSKPDTGRSNRAAHEHGSQRISSWTPNTIPYIIPVHRGSAVRLRTAAFPHHADSERVQSYWRSLRGSTRVVPHPPESGSAKRPVDNDCRRLGLPARFGSDMAYIRARIPFFGARSWKAFKQSAERISALVSFMAEADTTTITKEERAAAATSSDTPLSLRVQVVWAHVQSFTTPRVDVAVWFPFEMVLWLLEQPKKVLRKLYSRDELSTYRGFPPVSSKTRPSKKALHAVLASRKQNSSMHDVWEDFFLILVLRALRRFTKSGLELEPDLANKFCAVFAYTYNFYMERYDSFDEIHTNLDATCEDAREVVRSFDDALCLHYQIFSYLNRILREGRKKDAPVFSELQRWLQAAMEDDRVTQPYSGTLYRGVPIVPDNIKVLNPKMLPQYISTIQFESCSVEEAVAESFGAGTLYIYEVHKRARQLFRGDKHHRLSCWTPSWFPGEGEVLLPPGVSFEVTRMEYTLFDGQQKVVVHCRELDSV